MTMTAEDIVMSSGSAPAAHLPQTPWCPVRKLGRKAAPHTLVPLPTLMERAPPHGESPASTIPGLSLPFAHYAPEEGK